MIFNLFKSKPTLKELITNGFIDIHSHILPGIDDGAKNIKESEELIDKMIEMGFAKIIGTPHTYAGLYENTNESIKKSFKILQNKIKEYFQVFDLDKGEEKIKTDKVQTDVINNTNNSHNNTNNYNTINVIIKNYGEEKEMSEKEIKRLVEVALKKCNNIRGVPWDALNHVLQQKHFNPKYPENQNLKLTNISSPIMDVYTNNKWRKVPFAEQIKIIIEIIIDKT